MWEGVRGREGRESDWGREGGKGANDQYGNRVGRREAIELRDPVAFKKRSLFILV